MDVLAGTAKAEITPDRDRVLVFGNRSHGTVHALYARCLVLNDGAKRLVVVTYDLNCLDVATPLLRDRCSKELGLGPESLLLLATHNHNAPIQIVHENYDFGQWLADTLFNLILEAMANEKGPVEFRFGRGNADWVRAVGDCPADSEVQVLGVYNGNRRLALFFNHPVHPLLGADNQVEPGHPGYACEALEARYPGCLALYADACGGNQFALEPAMDGGPMDKARQRGLDLADTVAAIEHSAMTAIAGRIDASFDVVSLPLAPPMTREDAERLASTVPRGIGRVPYPHPDRWSNWIRALNEYYEHGKPFPTRLDELECTDDGFLLESIGDGRAFPCRYQEVIVARIGPLALVALQGEVCAPIGMRIKDAFRPYGPVMLCAYMGEHNLYIPTRELVRQEAYQAQVLQIQYASPVGWDPSVEDVMVQSVIDRIDRMMGLVRREEFDMPHLAVRRVTER